MTASFNELNPLIFIKPTTRVYRNVCSDDCRQVKVSCTSAVRNWLWLTTEEYRNGLTSASAQPWHCRSAIQTISCHYYLLRAPVMAYVNIDWPTLSTGCNSNWRQCGKTLVANFQGWTFWQLHAEMGSASSVCFLRLFGEAVSRESA